MTSSPDRAVDGQLSLDAVLIDELVESATAKPPTTPASADDTLLRRWRSLLVTEPIARMVRAAAHVDLDLEPYDLHHLALSAIDIVVNSMGFEAEASLDRVVDELTHLAAAMATARSAAEHRAVGTLVVKGLLNEQEDGRKFSYTHVDRGGRRVPFAFRLLSLRDTESGTSVTASDEAILVFLRGLDQDLEDAEVAMGIVLDRQLRDGRFEAAELSADQAKRISTAMAAQLSDLLDETRRDVGTVDWERDVPERLRRAREHVKQRIGEDDRFLEHVQRGIDTADSEPVRQISGRIADLLHDARGVHLDLERRLVGARKVFLESLVRQRLARRRRLRLLAMREDIFDPVLSLPVDSAVEVTDAFAERALGVRALHLPRLEPLIGMLWNPVRVREVQPEEPEEPGELNGEPEANRYPEEAMAAATEILGLAHEADVRLSELLDFAEAYGPDVVELVWLSSLWSFAPERGDVDADTSLELEKLVSDLESVDDGTRLDHPRFSGADLLVRSTRPGPVVAAAPAAGEAPAVEAIDQDSWIAASRTRNWCLGDPLLDWLNRFGRERGIVPDDERPGYDERTDFRAFVTRQGRAFEDAVMGLLAQTYPIYRVAHGREDLRDPAKAAETIEAMRRGEALIAQAVLHNAQNRTFGAVDLLVRSDVLNRLVPDLLERKDARLGAPSIGAERWHYRVVDIKWHTLALTADGHAGAELLPFMAQVWIYNEALGQAQGYTPPAGFLLGRGWACGTERGSSCLDRLARIDHDHQLRGRKETLAELVDEALAWQRRLRAEGANWRVLPQPSVPELYPHMRNGEDAPWHAAKAEIADALHELTLLPRITPARRAAAHAAGIRGWRSAGLSAAGVGLSGAGAAQFDAVLSVNRADEPLAVIPRRLMTAHPAWRTAAPFEVFVDFETVSSLDDDFSRLPEAGGQPLIFQIGCGWWQEGLWQFQQWTARRLDEASEAGVLDGWIGFLADQLRARGLGWADLRIVHWSHAEPSTLLNAYNSARARHADYHWPGELNWFDVLIEVIRAEPIGVRGAFNYGLKSIAKAMRAADLTKSEWAEGPTGGLGAMVGAWWCDREAERLDVTLIELDLMRAIAAYNEVDCRAMAEIVEWLRTNR